MDDPSRLLAVKGGEPVNRLCAKEGRNGVEVGGKSVVFRLSLPALSLIGAEVLYLEGPAVRDAQESLTLTGGVDRESTQEPRLTSKKGASWAPVPAVPTVHVWRSSPVVLLDEERPDQPVGSVNPIVTKMCSDPDRGRRRGCSRRTPRSAAAGYRRQFSRAGAQGRYHHRGLGRVDWSGPDQIRTLLGTRGSIRRADHVCSRLRPAASSVRALPAADPAPRDPSPGVDGARCSDRRRSAAPARGAGG